MGLTGAPIEARWLPLTAGPGEQTRLAALLSPTEVDRARRYRRVDDRRRYIVRRGRLRELCGLRLGQAARQIGLTQDDYGKPYIEGAALRFNLSFSGDLALVVLTDGREVGCDIEWRRPGLASRRVAESLFSAREAQALGNLPTAQFVRAFFACWTRKEALVKGLGLGLSLPLKEFDVSVVPDCPAPHLDGAPGWSLRAFEPTPGLHAAIAFRT